MSYAFEFPESVPAAIRRMAREQVEEALDLLESPGADPDGAVHETRKGFKKVRALLRLVRDEIGPEAYARENRSYRDLGRLLAPARRWAVYPDTLDRLAQAAGKEEEDRPSPGSGSLLEKDPVLEFRAEVERRHRRTLDEALSESGPMEEVAEGARGALDRMSDWPLQPRGFQALGGGLERTYRRGRERMAEAYDDPVASRFHEWRKRSKDLWYHLRVLTPLDETALVPEVERLHTLGTLLGEANDLDDLLRLLADDPGLLPSDSVRKGLRALARDRREALWGEARPLAEAVYREAPEEFTARIQGYWRRRGDASSARS